MKKSALAWAAVLLSVSIGAAPTASAAVYSVKAGDSLWGIATAHQIMVKELMTLNQLTSSSLFPGQTLQVPDTGNYIVKPGDTMYGIAKRAGIPFKVLMNANRQLSNPNNIWPGLRINVPTPPPKFTNGILPLAKGTYTPFVNNYADGRNWSPNGGTVRKHEGVDMMAREGTPVYAATDGTILNVGWNTYGGYRLTVKADSTTVMYYAHLSRYSQTFVKGGTVNQGQLIGYVGSTGYGPEGTSGTFVPHLHFGMYDISGTTWQSVDPYDYMKWWELRQ
jgi:LysM repeat protein